jgi:hypothetical protein
MSVDHSGDEDITDELARLGLLAAAMPDGYAVVSTAGDVAAIVTALPADAVVTVDPVLRAIPGWEDLPDTVTAVVARTPFLGVRGDPLSYPVAGAVGVDPAAQPWSAPDQRLVGDLDHVAVHGDQPGRDERPQHCFGRVGIGAVRDQPGVFDGAAGVRDAVAHRHETQHDVLGRCLRGRVQAVIGGLDGGSDG